MEPISDRPGTGTLPRLTVRTREPEQAARAYRALLAMAGPPSEVRRSGATPAPLVPGSIDLTA